jgi:hypothetical protein
MPVATVASRPWRSSAANGRGGGFYNLNKRRHRALLHPSRSFFATLMEAIAALSMIPSAASEEQRWRKT